MPSFTSPAIAAPALGQSFCKLPLLQLCAAAGSESQQAHRDKSTITIQLRRPDENLRLGGWLEGVVDREGLARCLPRNRKPSEEGFLLAEVLC